MHRILAILAVLILGGCAQVASATTAYPSGLDNFTNPTGTAALSTGAGGRTHSQMHGDLNDAIEAVQAQLGVVASAVAGTVHYRLGVIETAITAWSASSTNTVTNKTINGNNNTLTVLAGSQLSGQVPLTNGGLGVSLTDPNADRIAFWDDSAGSFAWLTAGSGLTISGTTITASAPGSAALATAISALTPTAYWRLNETSGDFQDSGAGNYDAVLTGSVTRAVSALLTDAGARYPNFAAASGAYGATSSLLGITPPITGSWSACAIVRPINSTGTAGRYLFGIVGGAETEANNDQLILYLESDQLKVFWEYSAGTNVTILGPGGLQAHETMLACAVKVSASSRVDFYVNAVLSANPTYANEPTGGSSAVAVVMGHTGSATSVIGGEVAFFNGVELTQSQIESLAIAAGVMGK